MKPRYNIILICKPSTHINLIFIATVMLLCCLVPSMMGQTEKFLPQSINPNFRQLAVGFRSSSYGSSSSSRKYTRETKSYSSRGSSSSYTSFYKSSYSSSRYSSYSSSYSSSSLTSFRSTSYGGSKSTTTSTSQYTSRSS